ncbi:MAG: hypothetical protein HYW78_02870 [Parcubacteria group bacterium]|nr:hypothetical protein [Parcubacteria group bacterium]
MKQLKFATKDELVEAYIKEKYRVGAIVVLYYAGQAPEEISDLFQLLFSSHKKQITNFIKSEIAIIECESTPVFDGFEEAKRIAKAFGSATIYVQVWLNGNCVTDNSDNTNVKR